MRRLLLASVVLVVTPFLLAGCARQPSRSTGRSGRSAVPAPAPETAPTTTPSTAVPGPAAQGAAGGGYGCDAALAYLAAHAAPGFRFVCPGDADGHDGMMCDDDAARCPGDKVIVIAEPCWVAYMNEASNSLVAEGLSSAPIDPYPGACPR